MSRGTVEAQTLRTEQFEFEARTSDPADAQPGEYWIRTDQTSTNPDVIAELRRQDASGVTTCPIFAASEQSNLGTDVTRGPSVVLDDGSVGFIVMTTGRGAVGSPRAVNSAGTQYVSHNALELSPIPDSEDLHAQYDATAISASDGDSISTWSDETGNGFDLTAGTAPTFKTSIINGNPVVRFDGTDDFLDVAFSALSQPNHIFVVFQLNSTGSATDSILDSANDSKRHAISHNGSSNYGMFAGSAIDGGSPDTNPHIRSDLFNTTSSSLRIDGSQVASGDVGSQSLDGFRAASRANDTDFADVDIGEILIYPQEKSGIESDVENYLSDKWGITI